MRQTRSKDFQNRVDNYVNYRPHYPEAVLNYLIKELNFSAASVVADVGSGTGILSELFLKHGNRVLGVEPNEVMREAAEHLLAQYDSFKSIDGTAEATTLTADSVDFIAVGQAFHWFDVEQTKREFLRILKPAGWVALIWNARQRSGSSFMRAYEQLLHEYATGYKQVYHHRIDDQALQDFFCAYQMETFSNKQYFDYEGLQGRLLSSSYAPLPGHPRHQPMLAELRRIFDEFQVGGAVRFDYQTQVYSGQLTPQSPG